MFLQRKKTRVLLAPLVALLAAPQGQRARAASVPILRPTLTVLGEPSLSGRDPAPLDNVALSPNGRLITYTAGNDCRVWNTLTHEDSLLLSGPVHVLTWGRSGDRVVFQTHQGPLQYKGAELSRDPAIWTLRLDPLSGTSLEPPHLVATVPVNHGLFFSPDEQTIAFTMFHGSYVSSLAVVPAAGGTPRILASGIEVSGGQWNSDGSAVYYGAYTDASSSTRKRFRVPLAGGPPVAIAEGRNVDIAAYEAPSTDPAWGVRDPATGRNVAYMTYPADLAVSDWAGLAAWPGRHEIAAVREVHPRGLRLVNLASGDFRDVVDTNAEVGVPTWFAQGDRLAVIVRQNGGTALLIENADGSGARRLPFSKPPLFGGPLVGAVSPAYDRAQLRISPDGRYAAFKGAESETIELMDLASGRQRTLITVIGDGTAPEGKGIGALAWRRDSKSIRYLAGIWTTAPEAAVHEVTVAGEDQLIRRLPMFIYGPRPFFPSTTEPDVVEFAAGRSLFSGDAVRAVTLVPIDGAAPRVVLPEPAMGGPRAPDGKTLAVQAPRPNGQPGVLIKLVPVNGSGMSTLDLPFIALPGVQWHPDGKRLLVLGREKPGAPVRLYSVPIDGGTPTVVADVGSSRQEGALAVSPDGRFTAVTVAGTPKAIFLKLDYDLSGFFAERK